MKQIFLSAIVILGFIFYALQKGTRNLSLLSPANQNPVFTGKYKDGEYVGQPTDAYYGIVQVKAIIAGGKITDVQFLQYPNEQGTSKRINDRATPILASEAIAVQSDQVDTVSGATQTSEAFRESLKSALQKATL